MIITPFQTNGNSAKFTVSTKRGDFVIALSFTLRKKVWELQDEEHEQAVVEDLAQAIVSRHDPMVAFKPLYIFAEHNSDPSYSKMIDQIRKYGIEKYGI